MDNNGFKSFLSVPCLGEFERSFSGFDEQGGGEGGEVEDHGVDGELGRGKEHQQGCGDGDGEQYGEEVEDRKTAGNVG